MYDTYNSHIYCYAPISTLLPTVTNHIIVLRNVAYRTVYFKISGEKYEIFTEMMNMEKPTNKMHSTKLYTVIQIN